MTVAVGEKWVPNPKYFNDDGDGSDICAPGDEHFCQGDTAFFAGNFAEAIFGEELSSGPFDDSDSEFGSEHPGICHFVFLDGHVAPINQDTDEEVFQSARGDRGWEDRTGRVRHAYCRRN